jgi:hypothetical protein
MTLWNVLDDHEQSHPHATDADFAGVARAWLKEALEAMGERPIHPPHDPRDFEHRNKCLVANRRWLFEHVIPGTNEHTTAMHWAAQRQCLSTLKILVEHGADLQEANSLGQTVLMDAVGEVKPSTLDLVRYLVDQGVSLTACDMGQSHVIHYLVGSRNQGGDRLALLHFLHDRGAPIHSTSVKTSATSPLAEAVTQQNMFWTQALLELGAPVHGPYDRSPFDAAFKLPPGEGFRFVVELRNASQYSETPESFRQRLQQEPLMREVEAWLSRGNRLDTAWSTPTSTRTSSSSNPRF